MIPIYQIIVNEDSEVQAIALTDVPAIEEKFVAFSKQHKVYFNDERRIIISPLLIPDQLIYRFDDMGEYYLYADKAAIQKVASKLFGRKILINKEHTSQVFDNVYLISVFFSDEQLGVKAPEYFNYLPDGTLYVAIKIDNDDAWQMVKSGEFTGISIEGIFSIEKKQNEQQANVAASNEELEKLFRI